jgi:uncharacterized GH25 family protein
MRSKDGSIMRTRSRYPAVQALLALALLLSGAAASVRAEGATVLVGQIVDVEGRAIEGARVFAYDNADVRRPANFISSQTDTTGSFRMIMMPGKYWLVARLKKGEEYGPLMPGDKHSGEPVILDISSGGETSANFMVADLKDARKIHAKDRERPVKVSGRIINDKGGPVLKAYAIAHRSRSIDGIPDHVSAWVDDQGRYTLSLPPGKYFVGSAAAFPPGESYFIQGEMSVDGDSAGVDIIMKTTNRK